MSVCISVYTYAYIDICMYACYTLNSATSRMILEILSLCQEIFTCFC